jgi:hypothetical protein
MNGYSSNGDAFKILNDVRKRAGLIPKTNVDVPNQQSFRLWMELERSMSSVLKILGGLI